MGSISCHSVSLDISAVYFNLFAKMLKCRPEGGVSFYSADVKASNEFFLVATLIIL